MTVAIQDPRLLDIIDEHADRETLSEAFQFTEGPIWHPPEQHLTFSDIPANRLYRWSEAEGLAVYREPSNMTNGNTCDYNGRILSCEHATSRVVRETDGEWQVLASHFEGRELNSPNDIVVRNNGEIFFTDPLYGRQGHTGVVREAQLDFQGVYRICPDSGELTLLGADFQSPNGLCFGLDHDILFVADTQRRHIRRFRVSGDTLEGGEVFAESPAPDGLKIDSQGHLYAGGPDGVYVYHPADGTCLGVIQTPAFCANFTWGGDDLKTLFMTASTGLYRTRVKVAGMALF
jgi:gluconolactonase